MSFKKQLSDVRLYLENLASDLAGIAEVMYSFAEYTAYSAFKLLKNFVSDPYRVMLLVWGVVLALVLTR